MNEKAQRSEDTCQAAMRRAWYAYRLAKRQAWDTRVAVVLQADAAYHVAEQQAWDTFLIAKEQVQETCQAAKVNITKGAMKT